MISEIRQWRDLYAHIDRQTNKQWHPQCYAHIEMRDHVRPMTEPSKPGSNKRTSFRPLFLFLFLVNYVLHLRFCIHSYNFHSFDSIQFVPCDFPTKFHCLIQFDGDESILFCSASHILIFRISGV